LGSDSESPLSVRFLLPIPSDGAGVPRSDSAHFIASPGFDFSGKAKVGRGVVWDKERLDLLGVVVSRKNMRLDGILNVKQSDWDKQLRDGTCNPDIIFGADSIIGITALKTEIESVDVPTSQQWEARGWCRTNVSKTPNFYPFFQRLEEVLILEDRNWSPPRPAIYSKIHRQQRGWCPESDASEDETVCGNWGFRLPVNTNKKCREMLFSLVREIMEVQGNALTDLAWQGGMVYRVELAEMYCLNEDLADSRDLDKVSLDLGMEHLRWKRGDGGLNVKYKNYLDGWTPHPGRPLPVLSFDVLSSARAELKQRLNAIGPMRTHKKRTLRPLIGHVTKSPATCISSCSPRSSIRSSTITIKWNIKRSPHVSS
jgi:hypothetical protein